MSVSDEVKQRIDIVDFISRYVSLKKAGATYQGLCPFHSERTPSFVVFPHTGTFHCFGACGIGGDVITFLMRKENLEFRDALQILAKEAGVNFEENVDLGAENQRKLLYELNEVAAGYFVEILRQHPAAQAARSYLDGRGIDAQTRELFRLGYALDNWSSLRDFLTERGYALDQLITAGLVKHNEERDSSYDAFRGRVMIPIRERSGRIIGFGGRVLGDGQPKYLNTAETPVFHKSHVIYGLDLAYEAIRAHDKVVIVEGYMDVIAGHQHGFTNLVACMGTSLTSDQLRQLQRYTANIVLALDADTAGQQATIRGLNQARQSLTKVRRPTVTSSGRVQLADRLSTNLFVTAMPAGRDPDDVIRQDPALWQESVHKAQPLVDFYFQWIQDQVDVRSARGKGDAVAELAPLIAEVDDEVERQHYVQKLSRLVQVDEMLIAHRVQASARTSQIGLKHRPGRPGVDRSRLGDADQALAPQPDDEEFGNRWTVTEGVGAGRARGPVVETGHGIQNLEDHLLASLLHEPDLLVWLSGECGRLEIAPLSSNDLSHVENREILHALKRFMASDEQWGLELFQESLVSYLHGRLGRLVAYGLQLPPSSAVALKEHTLKALIRMRIQRLSTDIKNIRSLQEEASHSGNEENARSYLAINNKSTRDLFHLQRTLLRRERPEQGIKMV